MILTMRGQLPTDAAKRHPLLLGLEETAVDDVLSGLRPRTEHDGSLADRGDGERQCFFLLIEGAVRELLAEPDGREVLVDLIQAPALLGLEAFLGAPVPRLFNVIHRATWLEIPVARARAIGLRCPELSLRLLFAASQQLERRQRLLYSMAFEPVKVRLARLFAVYVELFGTPGPDGFVIPVGLSYTRLSQDLGVTTRSIDRALLEWNRKQWVVRRSGYFVVRNLPAILASVGTQGPASLPCGGPNS